MIRNVLNKPLEGVGTLPVELVLGECRILSRDRVPFPESRWKLASGSYHHLDFETFETALSNGLVFAFACEPEDAEALTMCIRYEFPGDIETYYDAKSRLLWTRSAEKAPARKG